VLHLMDGKIAKAERNQVKVKPAELSW